MILNIIGLLITAGAAGALGMLYLIDLNGYKLVKRQVITEQPDNSQ